MEVSKVKERISELQNLIAGEVMKFERETGTRVAGIDLTRFTSLSSERDFPGYVVVRVEL